MKKGVVFDMDGVLIDSEPYNEKELDEFCKRYDLPIHPTGFFIGTNDKYFWECKVPNDPERAEMLKKELWTLEIEKKGLLFNEMKELFSYMKKCGKTTVLEVVECTEDRCIKGAKAAVDGHILMGTMFFDSVNDFCREHNIKYLPFVGKVSGTPSVLNGSIEEIIQEANGYIEKGLFGFDLLSYRYSGDVNHLNAAFTSQVSAPICIAGSIDSYEKIDSVCKYIGAGTEIIGASKIQED